MANMIMASSKPLLLSPPPSSSASAAKPLRPVANLPNKLKTLISTTLKPHSLTALSAAMAAVAAAAPLPALAEQMEKAKLFDFNATLPIMMAEFLFLMVALDKVYFTPLGNFMDQRDAAIKEKLSSVKDVSGEVKALEEQAAAVMRAARAEIAAALNQMKKETQAELEVKLAEGKKKVDAELQEAIAKLEKQKEEMIQELDSQISEISQDIVKKVLPL